MNTSSEGPPIPRKNNKALPPWLKTFLFILEIGLVLILLVFWLTSEGVRESKSLWVLFFYSFPAEFLVAAVPHEPVILYFGKFYPPLTVALVTISGTLLTEMLNYSVFQYVTDLKIFKSIHRKKTVNKVVGLFNKAPFFALWIAGLTPIPFYPFRFLVVLARYPLAKYILALALSRTPRFYILAFAGHVINIPDYALVALFVGLILSMNVPFLRRFIRKNREKRKTQSKAPLAPD